MNNAAAYITAIEVALAGLKSTVTGDAADWRNETGFPKLKVISGVTIMLQAPVSPHWEPSTYAKLLGQQGAHVNDPSPTGQRSAAGYPMANGRVVWGDGNYADDNELLKYLGALASQNPDSSDAPKYTGPLHWHELEAYDWAAYRRFALEQKQAAIFAEKPIYRYTWNGVTKDIVSFDAEFGDIDVSKYKDNGGKLSPWID